MKPVVFIVGNIEAKPIAEMFLNAGWFLGETVRGSDLVQFTGGHDVSPGLYDERAHKLTHCWPNRDAYERIVFNLAKDTGIPMAGICRGGQFLNVMSGGKMWQDIDGHQLSGLHWAYCTINKDTIGVSSVHHQMMRPTKDADILLTAKASTYKEKMSEKGHVIKVMNDNDDVEACYYMDTGVLCFQPHPEYTHIDGIEACRDRYFDYLERCFGLVGDLED